MDGESVPHAPDGSCEDGPAGRETRPAGRETSPAERETSPAGRETRPAGRADGPGRLLVCPTPIGNLQDVTLRVLDALASADAIACEDTRRTGLLLERHGLRGPGTSLISLHERNERARCEELLRRVRGGETVALVSDAGMPLISDPGFLLVRAAIAEDLPVEVLPGPSAALTALVASGLPVASFRFVGFLPRKRGQRERMLAQAQETLIAFESPHRLAATLQMLASLDPDRPAAVCRELTKLHEEVARGAAAQLAPRFGERAPKGEVVLVVGAADRPAAAERVTVPARRD